MARKGEAEICQSCGNGYVYRDEAQCSNCDEIDARAARHQEIDVLMLDAVDDIEELKEWIKEYLIK